MSTTTAVRTYLTKDPDGYTFIADGDYIRSVVQQLPDDAVTDTDGTLTVAVDDGDWRFEGVQSAFERLDHDHYMHHTASGQPPVRRDQLSTVLTIARTRWQRNATPWLLVNGTIVLVGGDQELARYIPVKDEA